MAEIIERVAVERVERVNPEHLFCETCGCGADTGSLAAKEWPEPGEPCGFCAKTGRDGVVTVVPEHRWVERFPGYNVVRCECRAEVACTDAFLNTCGRCGADYDGQGNRLAPREFWGEETGETASDILIGGPDPEDMF